MQTLSYGFQKPVTGDKGSVFFPGLEADIQQMNDHTHNGSDSVQLTAASVLAVTQALAAADWVSGGGGSYSQLVTVPLGLTFDSYVIQFREAVTKRPLLLSCLRASSTTYTVYINDNSLDLTAIYT